MALSSLPHEFVPYRLYARYSLASQISLRREDLLGLLVLLYSDNQHIIMRFILGNNLAMEFRSECIVQGLSAGRCSPETQPQNVKRYNKPMAFRTWACSRAISKQQMHLFIFNLMSMVAYIIKRMVTGL